MAFLTPEELDRRMTELWIQICKEQREKMNMVPSKCTWCGCNIQVSQAEYKNPDAHLCAACVGYISSIPTDPDKEFELTEEELAMCNDDLEEELLWEDMPGLNEPSCECGAEKIGSPWHSRWCPIFDDPAGG